jgi:hypothetical protein
MRLPLTDLGRTSRRKCGPLTAGACVVTFILWLLAVILVIWGIITLVRGQVLMGIALIIVGLLVGPGGVSVFT